MNKTAVTLLAALTILLGGCTTLPDGGKTVDVDRLARVSGRAAYIGSVVWLSKKPEDRGKFTSAVQALKVVESMESPDGSALAAAMSDLTEVKRLDDGGTAILYVEAVCLLWDEVLASKIPLKQPELVKKAAPQIRSGIERALEATK